MQRKTAGMLRVLSGTREVSRRQRQIAAGTLKTTNHILYNAMMSKLDQSSPVQAG